jgi:tetratricopeptide (TPR) repeat protein
LNRLFSIKLISISGTLSTLLWSTSLAASTPAIDPFIQDPPPIKNGTLTTNSPQSSREKRAQAYAKVLEGQRHLESGLYSDSAIQRAAESFKEALELDPTLVEARNAIAEISFLYRRDLEGAEREAVQAVKIDPKNFWARRLLSRIYVLKSGLREGSLNKTFAEKAVAELREMTNLEPSNAEGWAFLGELYQAMGRRKEAIDAFKRWMDSPTPLDTRFFQLVMRDQDLSFESATTRLVQALLNEGRTSEAFAIIQRGLSSDNENERYLKLLGEAVDAGGGDDAKAISSLQQMVAVNPRNITIQRSLGRVLARANRTDEAITVLQTAIVKNQEDKQGQTLLRLDLARVLFDAMRYAQVLTTYEEVLKESGITNEPLTNEGSKRVASYVLGQILNTQKIAGRWSDAFATIERMRAIFGKNDPTVEAQYALLLRDQGKRQEALQALRSLRSKQPNDELTWLEGSILTDLGRVDEAVTLLKGRLKGSSEDVEEDIENYLKISSLYSQAGRGREAIDAARKAIELVPPDSQRLLVQALIVLSSAQERAADPKGAEESLRKVLDKEPNNSTALNNLGYFLVERNERLNEALEMIQRAVKAEPTNSSFLDSLGWALFKLGRLEEAEKYLAEAARRDPTSFTIQEHLGEVYYQRGKTNLARTAWQKALTLSTDSTEIGRIKLKLNRNSKNK